MIKSVKTSLNCRLATVPLFVLLISATMFCLGCGSSGQEKQTAKNTERKLPKLKFHRPKTLTAAVERLTKIRNDLESSDQIPAPTKFTVIELIHGTGASAHSHYNLAKPSSSDPTAGEDHDHDHEEDHDDHHEDMESSEVIHEIEIDVFTELTDVLGWLPKIAAAAEVDETNWLKVNKSSKALQLTLSNGFTEAKSDSEKRDAFLGHSDEFSSLIQLLDSILADQTKASAAKKESE